MQIQLILLIVFSVFNCVSKVELEKHTALIMDNKSMKYEKYFVGKNNMIVNTDKNMSRITKVLTIFRSKEIPKNIEEIKYMKTYIIN